jgi:hypothetical protein
MVLQSTLLGMRHGKYYSRLENDEQSLSRISEYNQEVQVYILLFPSRSRRYAARREPGSWRVPRVSNIAIGSQFRLHAIEAIKERYTPIVHERSCELIWDSCEMTVVSGLVLQLRWPV